MLVEPSEMKHYVCLLEDCSKRKVQCAGKSNKLALMCGSEEPVNFLCSRV